MTDPTLAKYLGKTDDELYAVLGYELLGDGLGIGTGDDDRYRKFGYTWSPTNAGNCSRRSACIRDSRAGPSTRQPMPPRKPPRCSRSCRTWVKARPTRQCWQSW